MCYWCVLQRRRCFWVKLANLSSNSPQNYFFTFRYILGLRVPQQFINNFQFDNFNSIVNLHISLNLGYREIQCERPKLSQTLEGSYQKIHHMATKYLAPLTSIHIIQPWNIQTILFSCCIIYCRHVCLYRILISHSEKNRCVVFLPIFSPQSLVRRSVWTPSFPFYFNSCPMAAVRSRLPLAWTRLYMLGTLLSWLQFQYGCVDTAGDRARNATCKCTACEESPPLYSVWHRSRYIYAACDQWSFFQN